jgi:hypothetical protein
LNRELVQPNLTERVERNCFRGHETKLLRPWDGSVAGVSHRTEKLTAVRPCMPLPAKR